MIASIHLPTINAALNATSAMLLAAGFVFIRRRQVNAHRACMVAAFGTSVVFLACYVVYHLQAGHVSYTGLGLARAVYLSILFSHVLLAVAVVPLAIVTLYRAARGRFERHRAIARWTLPIWFYVSVTGVVVYCMLYGIP